MVLRVVMCLPFLLLVATGVTATASDPRTTSEGVVNQIYCSSDPTRGEPTRSCPFPFKALGSECYYISSVKRSWLDSRVFCQGLGGDLATPRLPYKLYSYVLDHLAGPRGMEYWVGASFNHDRSQFEYVTTHEPLSQDDWHPTLPAARPDGNCAYLHPNNLRPWANYPCSYVYNFICQHA